MKLYTPYIKLIFLTIISQILSESVEKVYIYFIFYYLTIYYSSLVFFLDATAILKYASDCHYSCSSCIGEEYYQCASCPGSSNSTIVIPYGHIDNVTYSSVKNLTIIYGECACNPDKVQYFQYVVDACVSNKSLDRFLELAIKAIIYSNLGLSGLNFFTQLKLFYLIDFVEILQFFGNFAMVNHKNFVITPILEKTYLNFNPTYLMNQDSFSFIQFFQQNTENNSKLEKLQAIKKIPTTKKTLEEINSSSSAASDISLSQDFKEINKLQKSHFKLSQALTGQGSDLQYFELSINFQMLMLASYILMIFFMVSHFFIFEKRYLSGSTIGSKSPQKMDGVNVYDQYKTNQRLTYSYEKSKYYSIYSYMVCLALIWFYLAINEQLIYLQVNFFISDMETKSIVAIAIFIFLLIINFGQILYMSRRNSNPLTKQKTIIFDRIKFLNKNKARHVVTIKLIFKIAETVIFFQFYSNTSLQLYILLGLSLVQLLISILIKAFVKSQYNILFIGQQLIKSVLLSLHVGIQISEKNQDLNTLDKLYLCIPALQFCYMFAVLFYNIIMFLQDIYFYCERKKNGLANLSSVSPLSNQSFINNDGKDQSKLINLVSMKNENMMSLNQSQVVESVVDQNLSVYDLDNNKGFQRKYHLNQEPPKRLIPANDFQEKESDYFNLGFKRKAGQQTELNITQLNRNPDFEDVFKNKQQQDQPLTKNGFSTHQANGNHSQNQKIKISQVSTNNNSIQQSSNKKSPLELIQQIRSKQNESYTIKPSQQSDIQKLDELYQIVKENNQQQSKPLTTTYRKPN